MIRDSHELTPRTSRSTTSGAFNQRLERLSIVLIALVALGLRMALLTSMEFKGDEAFNLMKANRFVEGGTLPLTSGLSSTGILEPPIFMYLLFVPLIFSDDAVFVTGFIAVLNTLGVVLCYLLVRRFVSPRAALLAAALYAVSPWQVLYSRKIWTQNLLSPFALLFLLLLFESIYRKRPRLLTVALGLLSITVQLHLSAVYLLPFTVVFLIWQRRNLSIRHIGYGIILAFLFCVPYLLYLIRSELEPLRIAAELARRPFVIRPDGLRLPLQLVTTLGFDYPFGNSFGQFMQGAPHFPVLDYATMALCALGLGFALLHHSSPARALTLYTVIGFAYYVFSKSELHPHYFNSLLPILFILAALPAGAMLCGGRLRSTVSSLAMAVLLLYQVSFTIAFLGFISRVDCIWGDYGPPYRARVERVLGAANELAALDEPVDLASVHERARFCEKWDLEATQYILKRYEKDVHELP